MKAVLISLTISATAWQLRAQDSIPDEIHGTFRLSSITTPTEQCGGWTGQSSIGEITATLNRSLDPQFTYYAELPLSNWNYSGQYEKQGCTYLDDSGAPVTIVPIHRMERAAGVLKLAVIWNNKDNSFQFGYSNGYDWTEIFETQGGPETVKKTGGKKGTFVSGIVRFENGDPVFDLTGLGDIRPDYTRSQTTTSLQGSFRSKVDIIARELKWDTFYGGLNFSFSVNGYLDRASSAKLFWAKDGVIIDAGPFFTRDISVGSAGAQIHVPYGPAKIPVKSPERAPYATQIALALNDERSVEESNLKNNRAFLDLPVEGIDVSHNNGVIQWADVENAGKRFVFVKATDGVVTGGANDIDPTMAANVNGARSKNMLVGVYHVAHPEQPKRDAASETISFLSYAFQFMGAGFLPPVLDLETAHVEKAVERMGQEVFNNWVRTWLEAVAKATCVKPIIYAPRGVLLNLAQDLLNDYPLWVTTLDGDEVGVPQLAVGEGSSTLWLGWSFKQYAAELNPDTPSQVIGNCPGVAGYTDLDSFSGTLAELHSLTQRAACPPYIMTSRSGETLSFDIWGPIGRVVIIQVSDDLKNWRDTGSATLSGGNAKVSVPTGSGQNGSYYRVKL